MAGALVGGAFLSGFINVVFDRFLTTDAVNLVLGKKLSPDLVERLKTALLGAEALVADAEMKQFGNPSVRKWLDSLRDAVYCAEDLLDTVLIKATTQKNVSSSWSLSFLVIRDRDDMVDKMEGVVRRIEDLGKQKDFLGLEKIPTGSSSWRTPTSSLVKGNVHGREDDKKALIKMFNDNNDPHLSVISIVGIGGVGKTTLAQWAYNNGDLMKGFDMKAWVCVSENFDIVKTTKNVLKEILGGTCSLDEFNSLQHALKQQLSNKKFFIVLDDAWSDDGDRWSNFMTPFQYGKKGSIVLLTTREKNVALAVHQDCCSYFLRGLSEDYCWSVFAENASFPQSNGSAALEEIGRKIVKKCDGLPLAAETLGRLLRAKHDVKEWNKILMSDVWEFSAEKSKIIPALLISYFHLPAHLKRCFVYCSLFPKDYQFEKDELILLWMIEDLLPLPKKGEILYEVGCECFDELTSRLFFTHQLIDGVVVRFTVHDLLHDLAIFLAGDFYCNLEELCEEEELSIQTRHLHVNLPQPSSKLYNSFARLESLRTLLFSKFFFPNFNIEMATCDTLSKCKYLRALSFHKLDELPDSIGELIHLRYLDLSSTRITILPESLCTLCHLQILKLCCCPELTTLPRGFHNLVSLQYLDIRSTPLKEMPPKLHKLKNLHIDYFIVGKHEDGGIQELGGLSNIHGNFTITKLENVADAEQARSARLIDKKHIEHLLLEWSSGGDMVSDTQTERDILDNLQPHYGLKELTIKGYKGTKFPNWLGRCSYHIMTHISLESCYNCCMLPSLGQLPSLKSLSIAGFDQLKLIGEEFYKNESDQHPSVVALFPSLERLEFGHMPCWEEWHLPESETFPQLRELEITNCPMLKGDMLNRQFLRIISSLFSDVSKVRNLSIWKGRRRPSERMFLSEDTLSIKGCDSLLDSVFKAIGINRLEFPEQQHQQKHDLVKLQIGCNSGSLTSLSLDAFPNLNELEIYRSYNLESVSMSETPHAALQHLSISECPKFVSFPGEGLAAPNLTHLSLSDCSKLKALPRDMNTLLPNLESLYIECCPQIRMVPKCAFPPNLKELSVRGCKKLLSSLSWMGNLDALTHLNISGYGREIIIKSFPVVDLLPHLPSLTSLHLSIFPNLEKLECNELLRFTSLQHLHIQNCRNLQYMEGEKLPSSLLLLQIQDCPFLGEYCKNKHQQIWPKIEHIPTIQVDGQQIL